MTTEHEASRTLVKSPPELWAECSDAGSLARHLGEFGEITITRLEPETTVAWEGEHASGTVRIEPSAWGTRVTLTVQPRPLDVAVEAQAPPAQQIEPAIDSTPEEENDATLEKASEAPDAGVASDAGAFRVRWRRMTASMRALFRAREPALEENDHAPRLQENDDRPPVEPSSPAAAEPVEPPDTAGPPDPDGAAETVVDAELVLTAALDSLGQAHHRPFSRA